MRLIAPDKTNGRAVDRGIVLPIVLIAVVLLAMLGLAFGFTTRSEYAGLGARERLLQARLCAMSGMEEACLFLRRNFTDSALWYDNSELFRDRPVFRVGDREDSPAWRFSLVGYNLDSTETARFGLTDEASKLNINTASEDQLSRLGPLVGAPALVAALLDWREDSDEPRPDGAKDSYYLRLDHPYRCKNAPLDTIEELLLVRGFTSSVVFGEDMNRNGRLDPNEDDGRQSLPIDNADGVLDRGLYPFITVYSREGDMCDSNPYQPRSNIQAWPAELLKLMLSEHFDDEFVDFVVTARQAGVDFGKTPANLIGCKFKYKNKEYTCPVGVEDLPEMLPKIMDLLTTGYHVHDDGFIYGRININTAPRTVLQTIGKLTGDDIDRILEVRGRLDEETRKTTAWLVTQEVMDIEKFKDVAYLFTTRSYQFTVEALGYCDYDGARARMQAVVELRLPRVQYVYVRDLTALGISYDLSEFRQGDFIIRKINRGD